MEPMALNSVVDAARHWLRPGHPKARKRRGLAVLVGALALWALFGGQQGLFALVMSQRDKSSLAAEIARLKQENLQLEQKAADLSRHPEAYERTARERLLLMRPGEIVYRFQ